MNLENLDDKIDDYVLGRRWNDKECWIECKRISVNELKEIYNKL